VADALLGGNSGLAGPLGGWIETRPRFHLLTPTLLGLPETVNVTSEKKKKKPTLAAAWVLPKKVLSSAILPGYSEVIESCLLSNIELFRAEQKEGRN
jgi:hypothetical protein